MNNSRFIIFLILMIGGVFGYTYLYKKQPINTVATNTNGSKQQQVKEKNQIDENPLSIIAMRKRAYPGSEVIIEQTLPSRSNYNQYIASYKSDGYKIYGLLTVPKSDKPKDGWPAIIFNHGYIPPEQYKTTERYVEYVAAFARNGYIVFKPDFRGFGNSEGNPEGAYYSPAYTTDVLNAVSSIKKFEDVNPDKIGMWGHSMGGNITLRAMVVSRDIKAGVIWAGVVGSYDQLLNKWRRRNTWSPSEREIQGHITSIRENLLSIYGTPEENPSFWHSIDPRYFLADISGPLQLHQGLDDEEVPLLFSESLQTDLEKLGKQEELFTYPGADHNISSPNFGLAMQRSIDFFNKYLKNLP